jgi:hypothetical protein
MLQEIVFMLNRAFEICLGHLYVHTHTKKKELKLTFTGTNIDKRAIEHLDNTPTISFIHV